MLSIFTNFYQSQDRLLLDRRHKHRCLGLVLFIFDRIHDLRVFTETFSNYWLQVPVDNLAFLSQNFLFFFVGDALSFFSFL